MTAHIEEVDEDEFGKLVLTSTRPVLKDFWGQRAIWLQERLRQDSSRKSSVVNGETASLSTV